MELQLTPCLALDMASQRISFLVVLLCIIVVTESFAVVRFWRPQGSIIENKGKKNGNVNKTKEKYTRLLHLWCSNKKGNVTCTCLFFFLLQMGKTITKSTTKTTRQQATKWRQNDKSATMIQVDNRLLSPEQELSSSSQIWHLLKL